MFSVFTWPAGILPDLSLFSPCSGRQVLMILNKGLERRGYLRKDKAFVYVYNSLQMQNIEDDNVAR